MYHVTRKLIAARNRTSTDKAALVTVQTEPLGIQNDCLRNAFQYAREREMLPIAGWLIFPHDASSQTTECIQHWWCLSEHDGRYYDYTPLPNAGAEEVEYVCDVALTMYAHDNRDQLASMVGTCLLYAKGDWYAVHWDESDVQHTNHLTELRTEYLFHHKR